MISEETLTTLEFDRVRKIAARLAASNLGVERLAALVPFDTASEAEQCMMRTGEMVVIISTGDFPIYGLHDVREELHHACVAGSSLEAEALLRVPLRGGHAVRAFLYARRMSRRCCWKWRATRRRERRGAEH